MHACTSNLLWICKRAFLTSCSVRTDHKHVAPASTHPSRPSFNTLEDMLSNTIEASGTDYITARKKTLARDGYRCMLTGCFDTNSCSRNVELAALRGDDADAEVQTCHILNKSALYNLEDLPEDRAGTPARDHAAGVMAILTQFGLEQLVDELIQKGGIHSLRNLLSLISPLHLPFDRLDLWFDETDEENVYQVQVARPNILKLFAYVNRRPHFAVDETIKKVNFRSAHLALPDPRLLALHAVCARVAHMSGAAEYFYELERDAEDTTVITEDSLHLLNNLLSPFTVVSAY
ncbi:hypothetical protein BDP27DRAFT_1300150 [Rhodocollybia butyracea]|uniref:HNH nuclease domain-containing protein n=1 Tax=Rhodocollybia butyracea TaxID=206335 RepID=A0A9P5PIN9_9AGAR|nr:hypothetical protein BDP27DRAFT_1300150 [Rhodocollybia butyracea]